MAAPSSVDLRVRFDVEDAALSRLHDAAFGSAGPVLPWADRLERFSVTWVGAFDAGTVIGFVHAVRDGGHPAFLLDTAVHPDHQRRGVGALLVRRLVDEVAAAGCEWLHVDCEEHLVGSSEDVCGFEATRAGLLRLRPA